MSNEVQKPPGSCCVSSMEVAWELALPVGFCLCLRLAEEETWLCLGAGGEDRAEATIRTLLREGSKRRKQGCGGSADKHNHVGVHDCHCSSSTKAWQLMAFLQTPVQPELVEIGGTLAELTQVKSPTVLLSFPRVVTVLRVLRMEISID